MSQSKSSKRKQRRTTLQLAQQLPRGIYRNELICWLYSPSQVINVISWSPCFHQHSAQNKDVFSSIFRLVNDLRAPVSQPVSAATGNEVAVKVIECINAPKLAAKRRWRTLTNEQKLQEKEPTDPLWRLKSQQDAHEFFSMFLDIFSEKSFPNSVVASASLAEMKQFVAANIGVKVKDTIKCEEEKTLVHSTAVVKENILSLELPPNNAPVSIQQVVDNHFKEETVEEYPTIKIRNSS